MSKFKVGDHVEVNPSPVHRDNGIDIKMPFTTVIEYYRTSEEAGYDVDRGRGEGRYFDGEWYIHEDMLTLVERPGEGVVIKFEDIRVGDTVRRVTELKGVLFTSVLRVADVNDNFMGTAEGGSLYHTDTTDHTYFLVERPEQDPEVDAIIMALDVDADTAKRYFDKGVRIDTK